MIQLQDIVKRYDTGEDNVVFALRGVSLTIEDGEFVAIIGASGSGKSTMMNILGCLDLPTSGAYILDGMRVSELTDDELALVRNRAIGFVFQNYNLLPRMPAIRQVELPLIYRGAPGRERRELAMQALADVGLGGREHHTPAELSGGQQQRVAIARALVHRPAVVFADEPTGNLDTNRYKEVLGLLRTAAADLGQTVVMVTHDAQAASVAGRIVVLRDGQVVHDGAGETTEGVLDLMKAVAA